MKYCKSLIALVFLVLLFQTQYTFAQSKQITFEQLNIENGLPNNSIEAIYQDKMGFIWLATLRGTVRYDGRTAKVYYNDKNNSNSFPTNAITNFFEDSQGEFWLSTFGRGANIIDRKTLQCQTFMNVPTQSTTIHDNNVYQISEDKNGNILATTWVGFSILDKTSKTWSNYFCQDSTYSPQYFKLLDNFNTTVKPVSAILNPGNLIDKTIEFYVNSDADYLVVGQGEIVGEDYFDFGRIEDESGNIIWTMRKTETFYAGGDLKNRIESDVIHLTKGKYKLNYKSDNSHSPGDWNAPAPYHPNLWGISLYPLSAKSANELNLLRSQYVKLPGLSHNSVKYVYADNSNIYWLGTQDKLVRFDRAKNSFDYFKIADSLDTQDNTILKIVPLDERTLLIATKKSIFSFDKFSHEKKDLLNNKLKLPLAAVIADFILTSKGELWFATKGDGIGILNLKLESADVQFIKKDSDGSNGLSSNSINKLFEDNAGSIWVGTSNEGVNIYHPYKRVFNTFAHNPNISNSISHNSVSSFLQLDNKTCLIGTEGGGLNLFDLGTASFTRLNSPDKIFSLAQSKNQDIWCGADNGLFVARNGMLSFSQVSLNYDNSFNRKITSIVPGSDSIIWLGIENFVVKFNYISNRAEKIDLKPDSVSVVFSFDVTNMTLDKDSTLWVATNDGLFSINPKTNKTQRSIDELDLYHSNSYTTVYCANNNTLWVGSHTGLRVFNKKTGKFKKYTSGSGFDASTVLSITEDKNNNLWISTEKGLIKFDPKSEHALITYDKRAGLPTNRLIHNAGYMLQSGELLLGSYSGLISFLPENVSINKELPKLVFSGFKIFNKPHTPSEGDITYVNSITLGYEQNVFSIEVSALNFVDSDRNQFAYKLEGFDNDWTYAGTRNEITYTNLSPGEYTLLVKGANSDGVWNETPIKLSIVITPPWYRTTLAFCFYILGFVAIYFAVRRFELNRIKLRNELRIKNIESERLLETDKIKSAFFANISHEFRTPLTLILEPIATLKDKIKDGNSKYLLSLMEKNAQRLLQLINQLLDIAKIESGNISLRVVNQNIVPLLSGWVASFETQAKLKNIDLILYIPFKEFCFYFDEDKLQKIVYNLLSNAIKFTLERGKIIISLELKNDRLFFTVEDTGIGISEEHLPLIFDRFYQINEGHKYEKSGTGIGLSLTKELVQLHRGMIEVESKVNEGTKFTFWVFTDERVYRHDEMFDTPLATVQTLPVLDLDTETKEVSPSITSVIDEVKSIVDDKQTLLLIDDNVDMRRLVRSSLEDSYIIFEASDGEEGLKKANQLLPDLIISDVMMPKMDGLQFCKEIKTSKLTSHIPVILLTAKADNEYKIEGLEIGADDYLIKPFNKIELQLKIRNIIASRNQLRNYLSSESVKSGALFLGKESSISKANKEFIDRVIEIVEINFANANYDIEKFGFEVGLSAPQLRRKMNALFGKAPNEFIRSYRLRNAYKLIYENGYSVSEAAYQSGFNSLSYFSKCFADEFGELPNMLKS